MTNLKSANIGMNKFCGPAVLSILTGKTTDECASVITKITGNYTITGVQLNHLLLAADRLGFDNTDIGSQGSLYRTLVFLAKSDGLYIITVPNHFVVIEVKEGQLYFCDNHTKEPIPASASARLMQQVIACHKVSKRESYIEPELPKLLSSNLAVTDSDDYTNPGEGKVITIKRVETYNYPDLNKVVELAKLRITRSELTHLISILVHVEHMLELELYE